MKKLMLFISFSLLFLTISEAQRVKETRGKMSQGEKNAFMISTSDIDKKDAEAVWKSFMKSFKGKTQFNKKSGEWLTDDAKIPGMSDNTVDVYAILQEKGKKTNGIMVWFDLGGVFLSSTDHPKASKDAEQMLLGFNLAIEQELAGQLLAEDEKKYKDIETDIKRLDKANDSLVKTIEKAQAQIKEAEEEIQKNDKLKEQLNAELKKQTEILDAAKKRLTKLKRS